MNPRIVFIAPAAFAAGLVLVGCGERATESADRDVPVTTQNAADAVAADVTEDVSQATAAARKEAQEGAAIAGRELEQAGDAARDATTTQSAERR